MILRVSGESQSSLSENPKIFHRKPDHCSSASKHLKNKRIFKKNLQTELYSERQLTGVLIHV